MSDGDGSGGQLPGEREFDPYGGDLDAQHAWREFGGLTIEAAYAKFVDHPFYYEEDFRFMGAEAFAFYFPVLDRYLRGYRPGAAEDSFAAIIGEAISVQLEDQAREVLEPILNRLKELAGYVCGHVERLAVEAEEQQEILECWQKLQAQLPG